MIIHLSPNRNDQDRKMIRKLLTQVATLDIREQLPRFYREARTPAPGASVAVQMVCCGSKHGFPTGGQGEGSSTGSQLRLIIQLWPV
jgi:hypothetical protein